MKRSIPIMIMVCSLLTGCGMTGGIYANYRPIGELSLIQTLGYDTTEDGVTLSASSGKQGDDGSTILLRRDGGTILQAMESLQDYVTEGELFFAHTRHVIVGREAAEQGIGQLLDFVERDEDLRLGTELYILENGAAGDLVMGPGDDSYDITEILVSAKEDVEQRSISHVGTFRETAVALSEYGAALVCLLRTVETEGSVKLKEDGLSAVPAGYAVLKDGKLVAEITGETAEAVSLLMNYSGTVTRRFSDGSGGKTALRFEGTDSSLKPSWNPDGSPGPVDVHLRGLAAVAETDGEAPGDPGFLAAQLQDSLGENLREALELSRSLDADIFMLGREMRISGGKRFAALPEDWLKNLEFNVTVEAVIDHSYDLADPVGMEGGGQK